MHGQFYNLLQRHGFAVNFEEANQEEIAHTDHQTAVTQRLQLENALAELSRDKRAVLDLRIVKGYSVSETAKALGKTEAAVRSLQFRALQTLARILKGND